MFRFLDGGQKPYFISIKITLESIAINKMKMWTGFSSEVLNLVLRHFNQNMQRV